MAKQPMRNDSPPAPPSTDPVTALAERLFVASWRPGSQYVPERFAGEAFAAAEAFYEYANARPDTTNK